MKVLLIQIMYMISYGSNVFCVNVNFVHKYSVCTYIKISTEMLIVYLNLWQWKMLGIN
jgi:hypothetical protein